MTALFQHWFITQGFSVESAPIFATGLAVLFTLIVAAIANTLTKGLLLTGLSRIIDRTEASWDDVLLEQGVFNHAAHFAPAIVIALMSPMVLKNHPQTIVFITKGITIYMIVIGILTFDALLNASTTIFQNFNISKKVPIKVVAQLLKIVAYFIGAILIIAALLDKTPLYLLSGLGALTAIFMLIFKDAILGFVAGIQLTANNMVSNGDWIEMPKYGADGDVLEVSLTTVKIQNWDKTITTIPTYALISESFKNWRGMSESGGRRIKRAIYIDLNTLRFCTEEMITRFSKIQFLKPYIASKQGELKEYNIKHRVDDSSLANGRRLTNIGMFRAYVLSYLKNHPKIHQEMTFLVRHLALTTQGLPIEIYVFCKETDWEKYEAIQADIFDHLLSSVPEFGLKVFQNPSGGDFKHLSEGSYKLP